jgi:hypothetical protein
MANHIKKEKVYIIKKQTKIVATAARLATRSALFIIRTESAYVD